MKQNNEPLDLEYTLTSDDVYNALKTSRTYRKNVVKAVIETAVLAALVILFGIWWILWDDGNAMIFCIACACLIGLVWAVVLFSIRSNCNKFLTGETVYLTITDTELQINRQFVNGWSIPLDGSVVCEERNGVLILNADQKEWTLIPLKSIPQQELVRARILQNTRRLEQ